MKFYTNVQLVGDNFLVRGYENGKHFMTREKFYPTLFVPSKRKSKYKTLTGDYVEPVNPGTVRESREFIKRYDGVENFSVYGNDRYIYQYISEMYPEPEVKFDISNISSAADSTSGNPFSDLTSISRVVNLILLISNLISSAGYISEMYW